MCDIPGFRFSPSEYELVCYYLRRKIKGQPLPEEEGLMEELNIYESEPWNLFNKESSEVHYVFTKLKKKGNGQSRIDRTAGCGTWDGQNSHPVNNKKGKTVGLRKYFVFEQNRSRIKNGKNGDWVMYEFSLMDENLSDYVLCKILNKEGGKEDKEADNEARHSKKKRTFDDLEDVQEENHGKMMKTQEFLDSADKVGEETFEEEFNVENLLSDLLKMDYSVGGVDLDIGRLL